MMDYALLLQLLTQAEERIASGIRVIANQRAAVARLTADGHVTEDAEGMLTCFEQAHAIDLADREHIKKELARSAW